MNKWLDAFRLNGKIVMITGASSGLGRGFARAVAGVDGTLVLAARREERLRELADELTADGADVVFQATDVGDPDACDRLVATARERFGRVDVLVNNAGVGDAMPASRETPEIFRRVIDVNLNGLYYLARACAPTMPPGSSIVNVASVHGLVASRFPQASYAASKSGVIGLTRDLAQQWSGRKGIRVNALCPGYFVTEMNAHAMDSIRPVVASQSLLGRLGEQHELDSALIYLASDASSYITGTTLAVDGGYSAI